MWAWAWAWIEAQQSTMCSFPQSGSAREVSQRLDDQAERGQTCLMHRAWPAESQAGMVHFKKSEAAVYHQGHSCPSADLGVQGFELSRGAEDAAGEAPLLDLLAVEQHDRLRPAAPFTAVKATQDCKPHRLLLQRQDSPDPSCLAEAATCHAAFRGLMMATRPMEHWRTPRVVSKRHEGLYRDPNHLVGVATERANLEGGGGGVGARQVVPRVLPVGCPGHKQVVAGCPEHDVISLVMLQSLRST